ncbi:MAG: hypothetical protein QF918_06620 [Pirellulaceae bacterium]|jgi:thiol:disulfide interchange protein|nr:hypothetical protein [Pirellulaceae bacterium]MDP6555792.1 hypothetical protein [Pirellulaceae bacterium]MDP6720801.1 hypothetical protein [Pirellulaceae bacterium]
MKLRTLGVLSVLLLASACGRSKIGPVGSDTSDPNYTPAPIVSAETSTDQPTTKIANWEETQQLVAQNPGKVVILDLWASW